MELINMKKYLFSVFLLCMFVNPAILSATPKYDYCDHLLLGGTPAEEVLFLSDDLVCVVSESGFSMLEFRNSPVIKLNLSIGMFLDELNEVTFVVDDFVFASMTQGKNILSASDFSMAKSNSIVGINRSTNFWDGVVGFFKEVFNSDPVGKDDCEKIQDVVDDGLGDNYLMSDAERRRIARDICDDLQRRQAEFRAKDARIKAARKERDELERRDRSERIDRMHRGRN
jgi:hypothetical protein